MAEGTDKKQEEQHRFNGGKHARIMYMYPPSKRACASIHARIHPKAPTVTSQPKPARIMHVHHLAAACQNGTVRREVPGCNATHSSTHTHAHLRIPTWVLWAFCSRHPNPPTIRFLTYSSLPNIHHHGPSSRISPGLHITARNPRTRRTDVVDQKVQVGPRRIINCNNKGGESKRFVVCISTHALVVRIVKAVKRLTTPQTHG